MDMRNCMNFFEIYKSNRRMVVIHHVLDDDFVISRIKENDLLFFDDCLYSQYIFIEKYHKRLLEMNIVCVMGLSTKAIRPENMTGIANVESHVLHNEMNTHIKTMNDDISGDFISGFMSKSEIDEIIKLPNVFLALHGCCHLKLENINNVLKRMETFISDTYDGIKILKELGYNTNIYIYPYDYEPSIGNTFLRRVGFDFIFGGNDTKRIYIENL